MWTIEIISLLGHRVLCVTCQHREEGGWTAIQIQHGCDLGNAEARGESSVDMANVGVVELDVVQSIILQ